MQGGSTVSFEALVDRLLPHLIKFVAFGKNVPEADAEELAVDVLMTVHEKINTFQYSGKAKLTTWVFQIAKNRALDYHRTSVPVESALPQDPPQVDFGDALCYAGRNQEKLEWLGQQLKEFSAEDQWLLKWRAEEVPYSQIAQWLGIAEGTARVRHKRAMEKLLAKAGVVQKGAART